MSCEPLIDAKTAAQILNLHERTVKEMAASGRLPAMRLGRLWRFRASTLDKWAEDNLLSNCHSRPSKENIR